MAYRNMPSFLMARRKKAPLCPSHVRRVARLGGAGRWGGRVQGLCWGGSLAAHIGKGKMQIRKTDFPAPWIYLWLRIWLCLDSAPSAPLTSFPLRLSSPSALRTRELLVFFLFSVARGIRSMAARERAWERRLLFSRYVFFYEKQLYYQQQEAVWRVTECRVTERSTSLREH